MKGELTAGRRAFLDGLASSAFPDQLYQTFAFAQVGDVDYLCRFHEALGMRGTIHVTTSGN